MTKRKRGSGRSGAGRRGPRARRETSAGGVVFRVAEGRPLFLLIRDSYGNWGFPKGHVEKGEQPEAAAVREVGEETGLAAISVVAPIRDIEWHFRFRGTLIRKKCHFFLMETAQSATTPEAAEGITECLWSAAVQAEELIRYPNAREVLREATAMVADQLRRPSTPV